MATRKDEEDYFDLGNRPKVDDFALGEPVSEFEEEEARGLPRAAIIAPLVIGFTLLFGLFVALFIMRAWDRTPDPDIFQTQGIKVVEPETALPRPTDRVAVKPAPSTPPAAAPTAAPLAPAPPPVATGETLRPVSAILPELLPAIGMVVVRNPRGISSGSGFVIRADGIFVTNHHVIENAQEIAVKLNNSDRVNSAYVIKQDADKDLAIMRFREAGPYPVLTLEETAKAALGEEVIVLGYPLGTKLGLDLTVTTGIVSSLRNYPEISLIQTNAAINHGNSGGPMIYRRTGRVIGVVTAKARNSESIGFAIDIKELKKLLEN